MTAYGAQAPDRCYLLQIAPEGILEVNQLFFRRIRSRLYISDPYLTPECLILAQSTYELAYPGIDNHQML